MPRLRQVPKSEASPEALAAYKRLFGDRDPVVEPGTSSGTPGDWWTVFALVPETSPLIGDGRLERAGLTLETGFADPAETVPEFAAEVTYEGLYELAESTLADGASSLLDEHFGALGGWIAATLVQLADLR